MLIDTYGIVISVCSCNVSTLTQVSIGVNSMTPLSAPDLTSNLYGVVCGGACCTADPHLRNGSRDKYVSVFYFVDLCGLLIGSLQN